ncbi:sensor histidine kinase [Catenovulum adriaticum]|uniref:ATP-binding protein n=1 Tax=Catenovulum adriaticum TaxID=2984846 RepID=A0ABY7ALG9_9ALTE|nr:ATP-binding protein [Catenovulum sp. TS8]WAJ70314.1 ATP-binding protein [Catenovulum sp. TS8]
MKINKFPSWVIVVVCLFIGLATSFKAKQNIENLEHQLWLNSAEPDSHAFLTKATQLLNPKVNLLTQFSSIISAQPQLQAAQYDELAQASLKNHSQLDEVSLGYYLIDSQRLSHKWSFGTANAFQQNDALKAELLNLYRLSKSHQGQVILQPKQAPNNKPQSLIAAINFEHQTNEYFLFSVIDTAAINFALNHLHKPNKLAFNLTLTNKTKPILNWDFNQFTTTNLLTEKSLTIIPNYHWHLQTQVLSNYNHGPNLAKANKVFAAGIIFSCLIACLIGFLAWLRHLANEQTAQTELKLEALHAQLNTCLDNFKRSAKQAVYSQLAPKAISTIPPYVSNVIKICSSLEEKGINLKRNIKDKKATLGQIVAYIDNSVLTTRRSAENMIKAGESLYNLDHIKQDLEQDSIRQVHLQTHIEALIATYKPAHKNVNFIMTVGQDLMVETYPGSLTHLLTILLNNSLEHGFKNRTDNVLMVEASFNKRKGLINIRVEDNGLGIDAEILQAIDDNTDHPQLVGIGLALAKQLAEEKFNGTFNIKSKIDRYTRITLNFPQQVNAPTKEATQQTENAPTDNQESSSSPKGEALSAE